MQNTFSDLKRIKLETSKRTKKKDQDNVQTFAIYNMLLNNLPVND